MVVHIAYKPWVTYLFLVDSDPVCAGKPLVSLNVIDTIFEVSVPFGQINLQKIAQEILQVRTEVWWEPNLW